MVQKFFHWIASIVTLLCCVLGMSMTAFAANPIMGDETQGTVKVMTILLIGSAVMIVLLVGTSVLKKGKK